MGCPDPNALRSRNRSGREEFVQLLLASLIVSGDAPRWNSSAVPSPRGRQFLVDLLRGGGSVISDVEPLLFVNEFELPETT